MKLTLDDLRLRSVPAYAGVRIVPSPYLIEMVEDWSRVRSPGRAARRRKRGHRQNIRVYERPMPGCVMVDGDMYVHPATLAGIQDQARERLNRHIERSFIRALLP